MSSIPDIISPTRVLPASVHQAIDLLVDRAKLDRSGAYWPLGVTQRAGASPTLENSLGSGNAGILLTLIEYYVHCGSAQIAELIHQGLERLEDRAARTPFSEGFYGGSAGQWYLQRRADEALEMTSRAWRDRARRQLHAAPPRPGAGLDGGCGGALIAILALLELADDERDTLLARWRDRLLAYAGVGDDGIFWDYDSTSSAPPLGFLHGNAGIEYCLARLGSRLGERYGSALLSSLARADALFDRRSRNWPDFELRPDARCLRAAEFARMLDRIERGGPIGDAPEFSVGWATGAAGILLARSAVKAAPPDSRVGDMAAKDIERALAALETQAAAEWPGVDASLQDGLGGIALALRASAARNEPEAARIGALAGAVEARLETQAPAVNQDDLSLLKGAGGPAYALLALRRSGGHCLDPLAPPDPPAPASARLSGVEALLRLRMPQCAEYASRGAIAGDRPVTLALLDQWAQRSANAAALRFEIERQRAVCRSNFRGHLWREMAAKRLYAREYGDGMEDNVLFGRFRLGSHVSLIDVELDPTRPAPLGANIRCPLLRVPGSKGIFDARLTPLHAALLREFSAPRVTLRAIADVIARVRGASDLETGLAEHALGLVRAWIKRGVLLPVAVNPLSAWMTRKRLHACRQRLFPPQPARRA